MDNATAQLTIRDVLTLPSVSAAEPQIVVGHDQLDRPVSAVHATAIADIARFLSGGEFLLTAGQGIPDGDDDQAAYVASLVDAGASGLMIELAGRIMREVPPGLDRAARSHRLFLATTPGEFSFADANVEFHALLTKGQLSLHRDTDNLLMDLIAALAQDPDLARAMDEIGSRFGARTVLETAVGSGVIAGGDWDSHDSAREHVDEHSTRTTRTDCILLPILVRGHGWGMLHFLPDGDERATNRVLAQRLAGIVSLLLSAEIADNMHTDRAVGRLVRSLLTNVHDDQRFTDRLAALAPAVTHGSTLVLCVRHDVGVEPSFSVKNDRDVGPGTVIASVDHRSVIMLPLHANAAPRAVAERVATHLNRPGFHPPAGAAVSTGADALGPAIRDAELASRLSPVEDSSDTPAPSVVFMDDRPLDRLLAPLKANGALDAYARTMLGPLIDQGSRGEPLLRTLRVLVEVVGNRSEAAKQLHMERRTVHKHVRKIESLLGASLSDPQTLTAIAVALRAHDSTLP
jgi:PucR family transcriptional regulator, purine catabolism regulatory protein